MYFHVCNLMTLQSEIAIRNLIIPTHTNFYIATMFEEMIIGEFDELTTIIHVYDTVSILQVHVQCTSIHAMSLYMALYMWHVSIMQDQSYIIIMLLFFSGLYTNSSMSRLADLLSPILV